MSIKTIWYKIKAYPIIGTPYQKLIGARKEKKIYAQRSRLISECGIDTIKVFENQLSKVCNLYFVDCGTLLGTLRNHSFISWDPDIDYGVVINDQNDWKNIEKAMEEKGFKKNKEWVLDNKITEQTYTNYIFSIDIFAHFIDKKLNNMNFYCYTRHKNKRYEEGKYSVYVISTPIVTAVRKEFLNGELVNVPDNAEDYIAYIYNDDWRVPNPNWVAFSGKGCRYIENKEAELHLF